MFEDLPEADRRYLDLFGRVMVLEGLMTRALASDAEANPEGLCAWMLDHVEEMAISMLGAVPPEMVGLGEVIEPHLRRYLEQARQQRAILEGRDPKA